MAHSLHKLTWLIVGMMWFGSPIVSAGALRVQAVAGTPFGVGEVSFPISSEHANLWQSRALSVSEANNRVVFPILEHAGWLRRVSSRAEGGLPKAPSRGTIRFLFVGDQPLTLTMSDGSVVKFTPEPHRSAKHGRLSRRWWSQVWGPLGNRLQDSNRPMPVENYIAGMGLWRMNINRHPVRREFAAGRVDELLIGTGRLRSDMLRMVAFDDVVPETADQPMPLPVAWRAPRAKRIDDVDIEPIATRAPQNCFYVRFGKYSNLLWATRLLQQQAEDIARLVTLRGYRSQASTDVRSQLAIQKMPFADLFADKLVQDVALIGRDAFLFDGPAFGVIIQSTSGLFAHGLAKVRRDEVKRLQDQGATKSTVIIDGAEVSFISTPDNSLRSFHLYDEKWHLITNSRALVQQFLATRDVKNSIAADDAFRELRWQVPFDANDTAFVYVPTQFIESMTTPEYVVELKRRLHSRAELELLQIAVIADKHVTKAMAGAGIDIEPLDEEGDVVEQLKQRAMLPPHFGIRCDGSRPVWRNGKAIDDKRGTVGFFAPITDMETKTATRQEIQIWNHFAERHRGSWSVLDPIVLRLRRQGVPDSPDLERLVIDARAYPLQSSPATLLTNFLGVPRNVRLPVPDDALITLEGIVDNTWVPSDGDGRFQLVIGDEIQVPPMFRTRLKDFFQLAEKSDLAIRVQPPAAAFDRRWWQEQNSDEQQQYLAGPLGLTGRPLDNYGAIAFRKSILDQMPPTILLEETPFPAQVWLNIRDLRGSSLEAVFTSIAASRALQSSIRNAQIFHQWTAMLGLNPEEGMELIQQLVGMVPVCSLKGKYEYNEETQSWYSTAWGDTLSPKQLPDYRPSILDWCHGIDARLFVGREGAEIHADVLVRLDPRGKSSTTNGKHPESKKKSFLDHLPFSKKE